MRKAPRPLLCRSSFSRIARSLLDKCDTQLLGRSSIYLFVLCGSLRLCAPSRSLGRPCAYSLACFARILLSTHALPFTRLLFACSSRRFYLFFAIYFLLFIFALASKWLLICSSFARLTRFSSFMRSVALIRSLICSLIWFGVHSKGPFLYPLPEAERFQSHNRLTISAHWKWL